MYWFEYNPQEEALARYEDGVEIGKREIVGKLMKAGTPIHYIVSATGWTEKQILETIKDERKG